MNSPALYIEQVSLTSLAHNLIYLMGRGGMMLLMVGLVLIDAGAVRKQNVFSMGMEKLIGFFIGLFSYLLVGHACHAVGPYCYLSGGGRYHWHDYELAVITHNELENK